MYSYYSPFDSYDGYYTYNDYSVFGGLFVFMIILYLVLFALSIVSYILQSVGFYTIAKRRGMQNPFFAFIPVVNTYLIGQIADSICLSMNQKTKYAKKLIALYIALMVSLFLCVPVVFATIMLSRFTGAVVIMTVIICLLYAVMLVVAICYDVYLYISLYKIFKEYAPQNATVFLVVSILFPLALPFIVFFMRNNKSGYEMWCEQRAAEQRATAPVKFEEEVAETSVEEAFTQTPADDPVPEQTTIEQPEEPVEEAPVADGEPTVEQ